MLFGTPRPPVTIHWLALPVTTEEEFVTDGTPVPDTPGLLPEPNPGGGPRDDLFIDVAHNSDGAHCCGLSDQLYLISIHAHIYHNYLSSILVQNIYLCTPSNINYSQTHLSS